MIWDGKEERRRLPRLKADLFVRYKILKPPKEETDAQTKDISGIGVCLVTRERLKPGTHLAMEIKFPHITNLILVTGRVVWTATSSLGLSPAGHERFDNGIEFEKINDIDRQQIIDHVNSEREKTKDTDWKIGIVRDMHK